MISGSAYGGSNPPWGKLAKLLRCNGLEKQFNNNYRKNGDVSTKKATEKEAMQVAFKWLRDGDPKKDVAMKVSELS